MQIFGPSGTRSYPLDRNPSNTIAGGQDAPAAGATDVVFNYTVPAGRRFEGFVALRIVVTTALAAGQGAYAELQTVAASRYRTSLANAAPVGTFDSVVLAPVRGIAGTVLLGQAHLDAGAGAVVCHCYLHGWEYDV